MAKPFDAALKDLIEQYPADWLPVVGFPTAAPIKVIDADLSTVTAAADKVLYVQEATPWLLHLDLQSSPMTNLAERLHWYNSLLRHRHGCLVRTVLVLLRIAADSPKLTGTFEQQFPGEMPYDVFRYHVVRIWRMPVESLLQGGVGALPLAPISAVSEAELPMVVRRLDERLEREVKPEQAAILGTAALVLTGLRMARQQAVELFRGAKFMSIAKDSSVYEWIVEEGALKEARTIILRQGRKKFGQGDEMTAKALEAVADLARLERMSERLLDAANWQEVLATA